MDVMTILISIPLAILANVVWAGLLIARDHWQHGKLKIQGHWAEWAPDSKGREFSIGTIEYRWLKRRIEFNGTNYHSNGMPFCHWTTTASTLNLPAGKLYYIFDSTNVGALQSSSTGFGVLNLRRRADKTIVPEDGYFMYRDTRAFSVSHSMVRIDEVPMSRGDSAAAILARVFPHAWSALNGDDAIEPRSPFRVVARDVHAHPEDVAS